MRKITLTEALAELKLLDKKIDKKINELRSNASLVDYKIGKSQVGSMSHKTEDEIKREGQALLQSLMDLIANRKQLKAKIAETNAITKITVAGNEYTIVEAIERKRFLEKEKTVVNLLMHEYENVRDQVLDINERAKDEVDRLLESRLSTDSKNQNAKEIDELMKVLLMNKEAQIIDPLNIKEIAEKLNEEIEQFEKDVDIALSIVNAKTEIEIDF